MHCRRMVVLESSLPARGLPAQVDPVDVLIHKHFMKKNDLN